MNFKPCLFLVLALAFVSAAAFADKPAEYLTLSARRTANPDAVSIQPYSEKDRDLVISQTSLFLRELYAHLALKEQQYPHYDPFDQIQSVIDRKMDLSDMDFHIQMSKAFLDIQDLHTNYFFPKPYACFTNAMPFAVDEAFDPKAKKFVAVISAVTNTPEMVKLSPGLEKIEVGDYLELYDGKKPIEELVSLDLAELGAGANRDAYKRRAMERLSMRPQQLDPLPTTAAGNDPDTVRITVRPRAGGAPIALTFRWISFYTDPTCLGLPADPTFIPPKGFPWIDPPSSSDFGKEYARLFSRNRARRSARSLGHGRGPAPDSSMNLSNLTVTAEPSISYKLLTDSKRKKTYGYLAIGAFEPYVKTIPESLAIIRGILAEQFQRTDGLLLDVRDNHGGIINYGEDMIQYFTPKDVVPETFRTRASDTNLKFIRGAETGPYPSSLGLDYTKVEQTIAQSLARTQLFAETAEAGVITRPEDANSTGQLYFKPVIVLTNSNCFSTCDMFTAGMQDHGAGEVWAVDGRTGGGGANVMDQGYFIEVLPKDQTLFTALPNGQDFRVAWRQAERVLLHSGELLEGVGAAGDHGKKSPDGSELILPPTPDDVALDDQLTIRKLADELARQEDKFTGSCVIEGGDSQNLAPGQTSLKARIAGTAQVEFFSNGRTTGSQKITAESSLPAEIMLAPPLNDVGSGPTSGSFEMIGTNARGARAWRKVVNYRVTPKPVSISAPFAVDFSSGLIAPLAIFNLAKTDPSTGWNLVQGELRTGLSGDYANNVTTEASLFADLSALKGRKLSLTLDAEVHTEKNYDFFTVSVVANGQEKKLLTLSGTPAENTHTLDLSEYVGQVIELRLTFTSDQGTDDKGVFIKSLKLTPL